MFHMDLDYGQSVVSPQTIEITYNVYSCTGQIPVLLKNIIHIIILRQFPVEDVDCLL